MKTKKKTVAEIVAEIAAPQAEKLGFELWDVEYLKEGPMRVLRIYIDKPGGVFIDDCVEMSRAVDPLIEQADPIEEEYSLEVSSPGIERTLRTDRHLEACSKQNVYAKRFRPDENGEREFRGVLESWDAETVTVGGVRLNRKDLALLRVEDQQIAQLLAEKG